MDPWLSKAQELAFLENLEQVRTIQLVQTRERIALLKSRGIQTFGAAEFPDNPDNEKE